MTPNILTIPVEPRCQKKEISIENRNLLRKNAQDLSQIKFNNLSFGCLVVNITQHGALLNVSTIQVPDKFVLKNYGSNQKVACKVVWRDHYLIGVKFVTNPRKCAT